MGILPVDATKATWNLESGPQRVAFSDRDNFTTNRVTLAEYADAGAGQGTAVGLSATFACVNIYAGTIASLTPSVMAPDANGVKVENKKHPLYWLLRMDPNFDQSAFEFWEFCAASIELHGNFYARKERRGDGTLVALEPIRPDIVQVRKTASGGLEYEWTDGGQRQTAVQDDMLHVRGFGGSKLGGASTLSICAATFGGALAADRAANSVFANSARPSGVLSTEERLLREQREELETALRQKFVGSINSGRPMLLDGGLKWQALTIDPVDAQMLESRKFSGEEICRIFGVPPAMVGYGDKASNWGTGKEVDVLGFVKFSLRKRLRRIEQALMKQLLTRAERQAGVSIEFNIEGLLRGDSAGRAAFYQIMVRLGVMTRNEARALENLPPIPGGDVAMVQMQDVPLDAAIAGEQKP